MEKDKTIENFLAGWNGEFPNCELKQAHLKDPHALMGALIQMLGRFGIDHTILTESPEGEVNQSMQYYNDLLPVINMTRMVNHLLAAMPQVASVTILHFLQPTALMSHSILMLLFNLMLFMEERKLNIEPYEQELYDKSEQVNRLVDHKHKLQEMLNEQAQEKARRAERLEKLEQETLELEEDVKHDTEACEQEKVEVLAMEREFKQLEVVLEQKRSQRDAIQADISRRRALRVYDAEDVRAQVEQATRSVQEAEEKYNTLRQTLMQKEESLKNLQTIKPSLDAANNLLHEITKLSDSLMELECGDLESDSREGELDVLNTTLEELQATRRELGAARAESQARRSQALQRRQLERSSLHSALRETTEKDRKNSERCQKAAQVTEQIKERTLMYEKEKSQGLEELDVIGKTFADELSSTEDILIEQVQRLQELVKLKKIQ